MEQLKKKIVSVAALAFAVALGAGVASANVQAQAETDWSQFTISATSVRLGAGTLEDPSGLRFKVDCPVDYSANEEVEAYTNLSFVVDGTSYSGNVPATVWREDGSGWNAVLLEIPASAYGTEITAKSYVVADGQTYESNEVTTTIAKTASLVMAQGATDEALVKYTQGAVSEIAVNKESVSLNFGEGVQLEATTTPAGYGVVWSSDNAAVASVSKTGKVTVNGAGTANVTASMGGVSKTVVVKGNWKDTYDYEDGVVASPLQLVNGVGAEKQKVVTLGDTKAIDTMEAFARVMSENDGVNTMLNFLVQINKNYIDWVFESHDYFTFTVYSDLPYIRYLRDEATSSYFYGYNGNYLYYLEGTPVTIDDVNLYRFEIAYTRDMYNHAAVEGNDLTVRFAFTNVAEKAFSQVAPQKLYFDDFRACDYTMDTIDFEDGKATPIGTTWLTKIGEALSVVETEAGNGNYALKFAANSGFNKIGVSADYLHYVFNVAKADFIEWKWFSVDSTATTTYSTRLVVNGAADSTGTAQTYYKNGGFFLCKIPRSTYLTYFNEDGTLISGAAITDVALGLYVKNSAGYVASGYADDFAPGWNTYEKDTNFAEQCVNIIDGALTEKFKDGSLRQAGDMVEYEASGAPHAFGLSNEFLTWAFYTKGAKTITFKYEVSGYDLTGFRFANNQSYCRVTLWYQKSDGTYTYTSTNNVLYEIVDGYALLTFNADFFTQYFDETGAYIAGSNTAITNANGTGVSIGARLQPCDGGDGADFTSIVGTPTLHMISNVTLGF